MFVAYTATQKCTDNINKAFKNLWDDDDLRWRNSTMTLNTKKTVIVTGLY